MNISRRLTVVLAFVLFGSTPVLGQSRSGSGPSDPVVPATARPDSSAAAPRSDSAPEPALPTVSVGSGGGLRISSPDGRFQVGLRGRIQALYQHAAHDVETNHLRFGSDYAGRPAVLDESQFRLRRGRLAFSGHVYDPRYGFKVQFELAGTSLSLKDAYMDWSAHGEALHLRAGQFKVPFGRQELTSIFKQQLVDRSVVSGAFADGWDAGAMVWGEPADGRLEYYLGVFNGEGINARGQQDGDNEWAARVVAAPLGSVGYDESARGRPEGLRAALGLNARMNGGWFHDVDGVPGIEGPTETCVAGACRILPGDDATVRTLGADVALRWSGLAATVELFTRRIDPEDPLLPKLDSRGWYADLGAMVSERVEAGVRYAALDPDRAVADDRVREIAPFVDYYLRGHDLKVQADYTFLRWETGADAVLRDRRARVQLLLSF